MKIKYDYRLMNYNIMIKDRYANPRDEKEIFEDIVNVWIGMGDSKKGIRSKAFLAEMLVGVRNKTKFFIYMEELCKEREEEEKIMCKEHDIKEITKKLKELERLLESLKKESSPYDEVEYGEKYYYIGNRLQVVENRDIRRDVDNIRHSYANYMDKKNAIRKSKEMQLNFLLDKFTRENGWDDKVWEDDNVVKYYIIYDYDENDFDIYCNIIVRDIGQIYFISEKIAQEAIEKYKDLFLDVLKPSEITKEKFDDI